MHHLINIGLRYEDEAHRRKINASLFHRPPNIKYVVARSEKTYISVSDEVYQKVKAYAKKKGLKLIEASWRLIAIGLQYDIGGDPKSNELFATFAEIHRTITDTARKRKGNIADEYLMDPETWALDRFDEVIGPERRRIIRQQRGVPLSVVNKLDRQKKLREELLVGAYKFIEALRAENALLKQKLKLQASVKPKEKTNLEKENDFPTLD